MRDLKVSDSNEGEGGVAVNCEKHIFPEHPVLKGVRYLRPHLPPHLLQPLHAGGRKGLSRLGEDQGLYQVFLLVDVNVVDFVAFVVSNFVKVAAFLLMLLLAVLVLVQLLLMLIF